MKTLLLFITILLGTSPFLFSQIEKGTIMVGGNAGFQFRASKQRGNDSKTNEFAFSLTPNAMYSVIKQLSLGGQFSYNFHHEKYRDSQNQNSFTRARNVFSIGPAVRANFHIGGKTFLFIHGSPSIGIDVTRDPTDRDKSYNSYSIITWRFGPGFSVFATKNMAVELGLYYDGMKQVLAIRQNKSVLLKGNPVFSHGLTVAVGLQFYTHKKQKATAGNP